MKGPEEVQTQRGEIPMFSGTMTLNRSLTVGLSSPCPPSTRTCSPECRGGHQTAALSFSQRTINGASEREVECLNTLKVETIQGTLSNNSRVQ